MGRPKHYSLEIAWRCQRLIEQFSDRIGEDQRLVDEWGGPLHTTFLLAMSTPMIVLPMERLFKPAFGHAGVADDRPLDHSVGDRVRATFADERPFRDAGFFVPSTWSYVPEFPYFPVAPAWPQEAFESLARSEAVEAAAAAPAADIMKCLRNALSHGGIAYLDEAGRQTDDATNMLGFAAFPRHNDRAHLRLLRISVEGYQQFLRAWAEWLADSGVQSTLDDRGPGWLDEEVAKAD
jgi:hypothetical protein